MDNNDIFGYVKYHNPLVSSFGKFSVTEETTRFVVDCQLITSLDKPLSDLKPVRIFVDKKKFVKFKRKK